MELTVDELARRAKLPVRTIREYQTLRLLPPPERRGRVGVYGREHTQRLALIARLQRRGYSLAGIKDLLEAWDAGSDLPALLGVDVGTAALDETPLRLTRRQLDTRLPGLSPKQLQRATSVGLVVVDGPRHFLVRSPALLALAADAVAVGAKADDVLDLIGALGDELTALADGFAERIVDGVWEPLARDGRGSEIEPLLRRGRLLLLQGVASTLADRLGRALQTRATDATDSPALQRAIDRVSVGAVTDAAGNLRSRRSR